MTEIPESAVRALANAAQDENCAAHKVLLEAAEITARGNAYRFMLTAKGELCIQEGLIMKDIPQ